MTSPSAQRSANTAGRASEALPPRCVLLIDLDNCPTELPILPQDIACFDRIIVCHGVVEPRVTLATAEHLAAPIAQGRMQILRMKRAGRNAADFGLAFYAGRLIETEAESSTYVILSRDADLDHVVELIQAMGRTARRVASLEAARHAEPTVANPTMVPPTAAAAPRVEMAARAAEAPQPATLSSGKALRATRRDMESAALSMEYVGHLRMFPGQRPARRKSLKRSIGSYFRIREQAMLDRIVAELEKSGHLRIASNGHVAYLEQMFSWPGDEDNPLSDFVDRGDAFEPDEESQLVYWTMRSADHAAAAHDVSSEFPPQHNALLSDEPAVSVPAACVPAASVPVAAQEMPGRPFVATSDESRAAYGEASAASAVRSGEATSAVTGTTTRAANDMKIGDQPAPRELFALSALYDDHNPL